MIMTYNLMIVHVITNNIEIDKHIPSKHFLSSCKMICLSPVVSAPSIGTSPQSLASSRLEQNLVAFFGSFLFSLLFGLFGC